MGKASRRIVTPYELRQPMKTGLRNELDLIINTRVRTRQAQTCDRDRCMTLLSGYEKNTKASQTSLRLTLAVLKYFGRILMMTFLTFLWIVLSTTCNNVFDIINTKQLRPNVSKI